MQAGYDYLLLGRKVQRRLLRFAALFLVVLGLGLLGGGIAFFVVFDKSTEELEDQFNVTTTAKSLLFLDLLPWITSRKIELLDDPDLIRQLVLKTF